MGTTLDGVLGSLRQLQRCPNVEEFVERSLDVLWAMFPCDSLGFNELDEREQQVWLDRSRAESGWEEMPDELFWEHADEFPICSGLATGTPGVVRSQDVISNRELRNGRLYGELLHPFGIEYEMKIAFRSPPWMSRAFMFTREDRQFTDRELELAWLVAPHLEGMYRRLRAAAVLTPREHEVIGLVGQGLTNREIAKTLGISPGTVRAHLEHAFRKLDVGTRSAAVAETG